MPFYVGHDPKREIDSPALRILSTTDRIVLNPLGGVGSAFRASYGGNP